MTLYEPKWSAPGDGTNTEPGEYEAWLEFKTLVEAGHLVPVEPCKRISPYAGHYETAGLDEAWLQGYDAALGIGGDDE